MRTRTRFLTACAVVVLATFASAQDPGRIYSTKEGVTYPKLVKETKPKYTDQAKAERIQGNVIMEVVVLTNGDVGDVKVTRSLDPIHGLDQEATKAVKQWKFKPGTKDGKPVPVRVEVEMTFRLK